MHISLQPEVIGYILGLPITNSLVLTLITAVVLLGGGFFVVSTMRMVPGKLQNFLEAIVELMVDFMANVLGDKKQAMQFFPLVAAFFLFILLNNWMGILPGVGSIVLKEEAHAESVTPVADESLHGEPTEQTAPEQEHAAAGAEKAQGGSEGEHAATPLFRSANSDLNTTLALALVSVIAAQLYGIRRFGLFSHFSKYFPFHQKNPIYFFVGFLEFLSEFAKVLSFSFRLFGNVFAGEVLLITIMTLVPLAAFVIPLPFFLMELFVGFIQALVFGMLTLVFLKITTETVEH